MSAWCKKEEGDGERLMARLSQNDGPAIEGTFGKLKRRKKERVDQWPQMSSSLWPDKQNH